MSTRCCIGLYESAADLKYYFFRPELIYYKHNDGYPRNMINVISKWLKDTVIIGDIEETDGIHGDIDYYYALAGDKILVYVPEYSHDNVVIKQAFKKIDEVVL